jgi:hypothetical protein
LLRLQLCHDRQQHGDHEGEYAPKNVAVVDSGQEIIRVNASGAEYFGRQLGEVAAGGERALLSIKLLRVGMATLTLVVTSDLCSETSPLRPVYVVLNRELTPNDNGALKRRAGNPAINPSVKQNEWRGERTTQVMRRKMAAWPA